MSAPIHSIFSSAALASGLLTAERLDQVLRSVGDQTSQQIMVGSPAYEELLVQAAVKLKFLNRWQAEQLRAGRTKFTLGQYQIIDSIGQGGMGHVFKAEHSMLGRLEAIKVLPKSKTTPESIASFRREIRAHAQLDHPNLVRLAYADQDGATFFFVTEFVPGADLRRLVRKHGHLSMQAVATIISQAAQALDYAHQKGLVHRDVKPGNLLVTPEGITKVADLGLAGYLRDDDSEEDDPRAGKIVGTADYLAPETIRSPGDVRPTSDIYSLGCTVYYAVTGKVPFPGGNTRDKLKRHCDEMPINPQRFNPELDDGFLEILGEMMDKDPQRRIQTAAEVVRRLTPWTLQAVPSLVREPVPQSVGATVAAHSATSAGWELTPSDPHALDNAAPPRPRSEVERSKRRAAQTTDASAEETPESVVFAELIHENWLLEKFSTWRAAITGYRPPPDLASRLFVPTLLAVTLVILLLLLIAIFSGG